MNKEIKHIVSTSEKKLTSENNLRTVLLGMMQMKEFAGNPFIIEKGQGIRIKDANGKWYIDG